MTKIISPDEANQNSSFKSALTELLYQLADDDFILAYRGSEWLGLAPHIEEDVAFSSINQDTMGHAVIFYQLLEELGEGDMDVLAHSRAPKERRNAVLLEKVNGTGTYLENPNYDWAFTVIRHYFYTAVKKIKMDSLKNSTYQPLADAAARVSIELFYHMMHWRTWFQQLMLAGGEARTRMESAISQVMDEMEGVLTLGPKGQEIIKFALIEHDQTLKARWQAVMIPVFTSVNFVMPESMGMKSGNGRNGEHTADLESALAIMNEVYILDPAANW